jgi:hypothetical protein
MHRQGGSKRPTKWQELKRDKKRLKQRRLVGSEIARNDSLFSRIHSNHNIKREVSKT